MQEKEIGEFLWKTSQEDLRILEKAAMPEVSDNEDEDEKVGGNGGHLGPTLPVPSSSAYVHECIGEALYVFPSFLLGSYSLFYLLLTSLFPPK